MSLYFFEWVDSCNINKRLKKPHKKEIINECSKGKTVVPKYSTRYNFVCIFQVLNGKINRKEKFHCKVYKQYVLTLVSDAERCSLAHRFFHVSIGIVS